MRARIIVLLLAALLVSPSIAAAQSPTPGPVGQSPRLFTSRSPFDLPKADKDQVQVVVTGPADKDNMLPVVVHNNSGRNIWGVHVSVTVRDSSGALFAAGNESRINPNVVVANGYAFGTVSLGDAPVPARAALAFTLSWEDPWARADKAGSPQDFAIKEGAGYANRIVGTAANISNFTLTLPRFSVACFSSTGVLSRVVSDYEMSGDLPQTQIIPFQIKLDPTGGCSLFMIAGDGWPTS